MVSPNQYGMTDVTNFEHEHRFVESKDNSAKRA